MASDETTGSGGGTSSSRTPAGEQTPTPRPDAPAYDMDLVRRRYGRTAGRSSGRAQWLAPLIGAVVLVLGVVVVGSFLQRGPTVEVEHVGYTVVDDSTVQVRFVVIAEPGTEVVCTLRAVNVDFTEVGAREIRIGPVTALRTSAEETITTAERAASGHAESCTAA